MSEGLKPLQPRPYILPDFDDPNKLKPCPFCQGHARLFLEDPKKGYSVFCHNCGIMTPFMPVEQSITAWNRRAEPDGLPEWLREKIQGSIHNAYECLDRSAPLNNKRSNRNWSVLIDALEWVLSLKRGDE